MKHDLIEVLARFISREGTDREWDDFISISRNDPDWSRIQGFARQLRQDYPPDMAFEWCSEQGRAALKPIVSLLQVKIPEDREIDSFRHAEKRAESKSKARTLQGLALVFLSIVIDTFVQAKYSSLRYAVGLLLGMALGYVLSPKPFPGWIIVVTFGLLGVSHLLLVLSSYVP